MVSTLTSGYSKFLPQSNDMHDGSVVHSKLVLHANVIVSGCLSLCVSLQQTGTPRRLHPAPHPMLAQIGSSTPVALNGRKWK